MRQHRFTLKRGRGRPTNKSWQSLWVTPGILNCKKCGYPAWDPVHIPEKLKIPNITKLIRLNRSSDNPPTLTEIKETIQTLKEQGPLEYTIVV